MKELYILTDYKGFFSSKQKTTMYRSGLDLEKLSELFLIKGVEVKLVNFSEIDYDYLDKHRPFILYNSSEDNDGFYKSFIENVIFDLEQKGLKVIPSFAYLQAHNNKVGMELLRLRSDLDSIKTIKSRVFGTLEELQSQIDSISYPVVIKAASGAMSRGVGLAHNKRQLLKAAKDISHSSSLLHDIKELLRCVKYRKKYIRESFHRNKFIVQNLIAGLSNDWKVLVYGNRCYALYRGVRANDFRASGSGNFVFKKELPQGMLDYAFSIKEYFNVPFISLDIGFDGKHFHLIEFQFINFGTTTIEKSLFHFELVNMKWQLIEGKSDLEVVFAESVVEFILKENNEN